MSDGRKYYCFCDANCKFETMTKEQILAAIEQAVNGGTIGDVDAGFITKVKEKNGGNSVTFWVGTQAQYNAIAEREQNCLYIITDETTFDDVAKTVEQAAADAQAAAEAAKAAVYVVDSKTDIQADEFKGYVFRKYADGIAECWINLKINNFPITESFGGFYATKGGWKRVAFANYPEIDKAPFLCDVSVVSVESYDSSGKIREIGGFAMTSGVASAEGTQNFLVVANKSVTATVRLCIHVMWEWKNGEG